MCFMSPTSVLILAISVVVGVAIGVVIAFPLGITYRKKTAEAALGSAEEEAKRVIGDAIKSAETKKKEAVIEAKDEIYRLKQDAEKLSLIHI